MPRRSSLPIVLKLAAFVMLTTAAIAPAGQATATAEPTGRKVFAEALAKWVQVIEPPASAPARTFSAHLKLTKAEGLPSELAALTGEVAYQAPDRLRVSALSGGTSFTLGRDGQELWIHSPSKQFALLGKAGVPLFQATPAEKDDTTLEPFALPVSRMQLAMLPLLCESELLEPQEVDGTQCQVLSVTPQAQAAALLHLPAGTFKLWLRPTDKLPLRLAYADGAKADMQIDVIEPKLGDAWADEKWKLDAAPGEKVETVALAHLKHFLNVAPALLTQKAPTLGPVTGKRHVVAREGKGRLEMIDGTRVLFLKGSPQEMGHQHGVLLAKQIRDVCDHILYGVGVGSSFEKGAWFFGEIEGAVARLQPFMDPRYLEEMDAIAEGAHMRPEEARLANFFPELFHCSGFSIFGKATKDGHMYHGRILDYMRGVGLEQSAVVIVHQPDYGNAWINLTYAGFNGSVTAMNAKGISIGEMGGKGYGLWDGKPMAHLVREVMEKASTLDEAVQIMRTSPRTCEYYYVISDGNSKQAIAIAATPTQFVTVKPGESHPLLPHAMEDVVLMSASNRYEKLAERVKAGYGTFDESSARELMTRPVCMTSNIQSVLFEPDTLDLWVANADAMNVASHTRYTHYNLGEMLKPEAK